MFGRLFETWHLVVLVAFFGLWVWSLVDSLRFDDNRWRAAGQTKALVIALIIILGPLGSLLYVFVVRPSVKRSVGGQPAS